MFILWCCSEDKKRGCLLILNTHCRCSVDNNFNYYCSSFPSISKYKTFNLQEKISILQGQAREVSCMASQPLARGCHEKQWLQIFINQFSSVQFSCSVVSDSLRPNELQHASPPCPSPTPGVDSNSRPSSWWCHPAISSSVVPSSSCPQSLPASGSFSMSQLFTWGGQSTGVSASASVLPMNIQD